MVLRNYHSSGHALKLNTGECCFVCLKCIRQDLEKGVNSKGENGNFSLSVLFRYLKITPTDVNITAKLCEDCAKINGKVQQLVQVLEVARMKIDYQLNSIVEIMGDAGRTPSRMLRYQQRMTSDIGSDSFIESERLRKELSAECSKILRKSQPRVAIARMDGNLEIKREKMALDTSFPDDEISALSRLDSDVNIEGLLVSDNAEDAMVVKSISNYQSLARDQKLFSFVEEIETTDVKSAEPLCEMKNEEPSQTEFALVIKKKHIQGKKKKKGRSKNSPFSNSNGKEATSEKNSSNCSNLPKTPTDEGEGYCKICKKSYTTRSGLLRHHRNLHLDIRRFKCDHCDKKFHNGKDMRRHRDAVHYHRRFKCTVSGCSADYSGNHNLMIHRKAAHPETIVPSVPRHRSTPEVSGRQCKICHKTFLSVLNLRQHHLIVHLGAKRFECDICGKKFATARDAKLHHDSVHSGIRHFCDFPECEKNYSMPHKLKAHQRVAHCGWHPSDKISNSTNTNAASSNSVALEVETVHPIKIELELD